jgi:hypothetical protein
MVRTRVTLKWVHCHHQLWDQNVGEAARPSEPLAAFKHRAFPHEYCNKCFGQFTWFGFLFKYLIFTPRMLQ